MQINICTSRNFGIQITDYNDSKFEYNYECPKLVYKQPIIIYCLDTWSGAFNSNIRDAVSESYIHVRCSDAQYCGRANSICISRPPCIYTRASALEYELNLAKQS